MGDAEEYLKKLPYEDLGFAKLDHHRALRSGFGEVVYCSGKTTEHLVKIFESFSARKSNVLGTRASREQYEAVRAVLPEAVYEELSRTIYLQYNVPELKGRIAVCTGGTSDIPVAGIHRLLSKAELIRKANCVVAIAGMEGALAGVIAGLVDKPVIAVPTSVGYGANMHGLSALLTMINSCAEGIAVVNIDNGFGAGYMAAQINRLAIGADKK